MPGLTKASPITVPYVITEPCIGTKDAACVEVCPVRGAIRLEEVHA